MSAIASLERILTSTRAILLAYSGGLDSSVLLHQLVKLRTLHPSLQLRAVHIHHGLSPRANDWEAHCRQQCTDWQVPLKVVKVGVNARDNGGIEAAARSARYQALSHQLVHGEVLLTAQHLDDQSETLLLALKRGSGPAGMAAMPIEHMLNGHRHLRPLLGQSRKQLENWARQHRLLWIEDESNRDIRYDRNFLRLKVMTLLNARWPYFSSAVARSATLCGEQEQLLDELLAESLASLQDANGTLATAPLLALSEVHRWALLRRWIASHNGTMPSRDALQHLWREVICSRNDAMPRLRFGNKEVRRFRNRIYWLPLWRPLGKKVLSWSCPWEPLILPEELGQLEVDARGIALRAPQPDEVVSIRFSAQGSFHIVGRTGGRCLKKLWQEFGVAPWLRKRTPLVFYNEMLIAALDLFVTYLGEPSADAPSWHLYWRRSLTDNSKNE